jgi:hypothetical protein
VNLANINEEILLSYACERDEFSYTTMLNYFVPKKCAKETLLKHKKALEADGKLKKKLSASTGRPVYYVPDAIRKKREARRIFNKIVDSAKPEETEKIVDMLQKEIERFRYREYFFHKLDDVKNRTLVLQDYIVGGKIAEFLLEQFTEESDEFKRFIETLDEPLDKGWITIDVSEEYRFCCEVFTIRLADIKKKISAGKIKFINI